jgi:hypothetical protein
VPVVPVGRRRTGGERWTREHAVRPRSRVEEEKSSPKLVKCPLGERAFFRPSTGDGPRASSSTGQRRSAGPRLGAGSQARRAKREADPPRTYKNPSPLPCAGSVGARRMPRRGRGCGGLGDADDPACPGPRRRGRPRSGRPQAPLEGVEKVVTTSPARLAMTERDASASGDVGPGVPLRHEDRCWPGRCYPLGLFVVLVVVAAVEVKPGEASRLRPGLMAGSSLGSR